MSYWYPKKSRVDELSARMRRTEEAFQRGVDAGADRLAYLSDRLTQALGRADFPKQQIARWLWVASQYRVYATADPAISAPAGAALVFLEEALGKAALDDENRRELNWILETTVGRLAALVGPAHLKHCLSSEELIALDERLSRYENDEPFDLDEVVVAVRRQLEVLHQFGDLGDLTDLSQKADALIAAAGRPGEENAPARAALRYVAELHDVVDDGVGVLGLIDDIYVLEWAYAAVENQTQCLPILDAMLRHWPFVATLGLGARGATLDRFGRYVTCAALTTLAAPRPGALALREVGPYSLVAAVAAAVDAAIAQGEAFADEMTLWSPGEAMTISDGTTVFHVRYGGKLENTARPRWRLHVADAGTITVGEEVLPYLSRASRDWKRLSNGKQILTWLKDRNVDALVGLTGHGRRRPERHQAVLLVSPRSKVDRFLTHLQPQGVSPAALLGARWVDSSGSANDLPGSATDRPLLYLCGDPSTAYDLIGDPPEHVEGWRVLVDGAGSGRTLHAALATSDRLADLSLCILTELHERESLSGLLDDGLDDVWYLEDQDVEVPPIAHLGHSDESDPLARFFGRRSSHWTASFTVRVSDDPFLEAVAECLKDGDSRRRDDPALNTLDLAVSTFLRRAGAHPLASDEERRVLANMATNIVGQASALAIYETHAARVRDLFSRYPQCVSDQRREALLALGASVGEEEAVAVVCRSNATADSCRQAAAAFASLAKFKWITMDGLRASAPYDRVVVPGWLGRHTMRELSNVGFGTCTDMLLLPFERQWYEKTMAASRRWERRLESSTAALLKKIVDGGFAANEPRWYQQASRRAELQPASDVEPIDDAPDTVRAETRAVECIRKSLPRGIHRETAKAQLVLFTEPGAFALLPPAGQIIVLPEDGQAPREGNAERQLFRPVSELAQGMLTALPLETNRDLVDAWADRILNDGGGVRRAANLWKVALKRHFAQTNESYASFARRLADAGVRRDTLTVRSWANDTRSVAPRNFRRVLPLIAQLTGDAELTTGLADTTKAIDAVYDARVGAADAIVAEIFAGVIDLSSNVIEFEVEGSRVVYALARVERVDGVQEVPSELVGRRLHLAEIPVQGGAAA